MAVRRMIHKDVICSDAFIDMSFEAQALFFQLQIEADEFGFVSAPKKVMRTIGANIDALNEIIASGFAYHFDSSGVIVLRHWNVANSLKNDRSHTTAFQNELHMLRQDDNKVYWMLESNGIQRNPMESQIRLEERRLEEERGEGEEYGFTPPTLEELKAFAAENGYTEAELPVERFINCYQAKGWRIGNSPMVDWQAKAREWVSRYREEHPDQAPRNYDAPDDESIFW